MWALPLYGLEGRRLTRQLSERAAASLGTDKKKAGSFYDTRASIVHPGLKREKKSLTDLDQEREKGFDLARSALLKLLRTGRFPDWDELVRTGSGQ